MNFFRSLLKANAAFWTEDRSLSALLIYLIINVFVLPPLILSRTGEILNAVVFSMILVSGVFAVAEQGHFKVLIVALASVTILIHWLNLVSSTIDLDMADIILSMISWTALGSLVLFHVFKEGNITYHRIQGAIAVYVLIGLIWSSAYHLISMFDANAFIFPFQTSEGNVYTRYVYFSFETLTTLGFGDTIPINPFVKSLVMVEGLIGQLFPAIMITRLVSLEIESRKNKVS